MTGRASLLRRRACGAPAARTRAGALAGALLALTACSKAREPPPPAASEPRAESTPTSAKTPWVKAASAENVSMLEVPATVLATPESNAGVSPPFRGRIVRVRVKPGERIRRGDVVADVVMPEVVQAAGTHASAATRVAAYERRASQLEALKKEGMVRLSEILEIQTKLAEARADQQGALAMLRVAGLGAQDAERLLASPGGEVALRSPIDGTVTQVKAAIGENREAAGEPIVRVAGEGDPRVEARCARALPREAEYDLWLPTGERHPLRLVGRAPQVDARDGTTLVWLAPLDGAKLVQGQTGKVRIRLEEEEGAVAVPARAVALGPKGPFVVARRDGKAAPLAVEVLAASGAEAIVRATALRLGDEVAADATLTDAGAAGEAAQPPPADQDAARDASADGEEAARRGARP